MWQCQQCNTRFDEKPKAHHCNEKPQTIDEYIQGFDFETQKPLLIVRNCLKEALPEAIEKISWNMPTYWDGRSIIHFAGHKHHIGLYPGPEAITHFSKELHALGYKYSKGAIQLPYHHPLPCELIKEMALWCNKRRDKK